jgi:two-component system chemotaxis response regulator CheB
VSKIKVLIVDDSAVVRGVLSRAINAQPDMEVIGVAADPVLATERIRLNPPDVITLDVEMPRVSGLDFLRQLMSVRPIPVVMVSSLTERGADTTMQALALGAVDFVTKPSELGAGGLAAYAEEIADKVRAAALSKPARRPMRAEPQAARPRRSLVRVGTATRDLIVIGASTGGVDALRHVLETLPADVPPIMIAQHMPGGFTKTFAERLDKLCTLDVKDAEDGEALRPGRAYMAPGGRHLLAVRAGLGMVARVTDTEPVNRHRPSVDVLFRSAARLRGSACLGVMLSGMGADGADAMVELREAGAYNLAQNEATCVVFGMPKQAIAAGAVHETLALRDIAGRLVDLCRQRRENGPVERAVG